jgi:ATP-dependent DNA helicase DinG
VVIADPRVVTKNYGKGLIDGLPPAKRVIGRWGEIVSEVRDFYAKGRV